MTEVDVINEFTHLRTEPHTTLLSEIEQAVCKQWPHGGPGAISQEVHKAVSARINKALQQVLSPHELERLIQGG